MDKKSGSALSDYSKTLERNLMSNTPWRKVSQARRERLSKHVKPGEVAVILGSGDSSANPLFKDAKILRE